MRLAVVDGPKAWQCHKIFLLSLSTFNFPSYNCQKKASNSVSELEMRQDPRRVAVVDGPRAWPPLAPSRP